MMTTAGSAPRFSTRCGMAESNEMLSPAPTSTAVVPNRNVNDPVMQKQFSSPVCVNPDALQHEIGADYRGPRLSALSGPRPHGRSTCMGSSTTTRRRYG